MPDPLGPSPAARRHPEHSIVIATSPHRWMVELEGRVLARSHQALSLEETGYDTVIYFPRQDVDETALNESSTRTTCPFKGQASYLATPSGRDVAWFYPAVYEEVTPIAGHVAFYTDRVSLRREGDDDR